MNAWWTFAERQFLRESVGKLSHAEIAAHLGRSLQSVRMACVRRRLVRPRRDWTAAEERILARMHATGHTTPEVARRLRRHHASVLVHASKMGLRFERFSPRARANRVRALRARAARGCNPLVEHNTRRRFEAGLRWPGCASATEADICSYLSEHGSATQRQLREADICTTTWLVTTLGRLVCDGLLVREPGRPAVYRLARRAEGFHR